MKKPKSSVRKKKLVKKGFNKPVLWVFIALFAIFGAIWLYRSFAATPASSPAVSIVRAGGNNKYWIATAKGEVYAKGGAPVYTRNTANQYEPKVNGKPRPLSQPIVDMAAFPDPNFDGTPNGYYLLSKDCKVYGFGGAQYQGDADPTQGDECRAIVATAKGGGYWLITKQGRIIAKGFAQSVNPEGINRDIQANTKCTVAKNCPIPNLPTEGIVSATRSGEGQGLVLLDSKGTIYTYGDTTQRRSAWANSGNSGFDYAGGARAASIAMTRCEGLVVTGIGGKIYTYANALSRTGCVAANPSKGGSENLNPKAKIVGIAYTSDYAGYWQLAEDGAIYTFGNAVNSGRIDAPTYNCGNNVYKASASQCLSTSSGSGSGSGAGSSSGSGGQQAVATNANGDFNTCTNRTLRQGDRGSCISFLVYYLRAKGYSTPVDELKQNLFGSGTAGKVKEFQRAKGLTADGIVGPQTWNALKAQASGSGNVSTPQSGNVTCDNLVALYNLQYTRLLGLKEFNHHLRNKKIPNDTTIGPRSPGQTPESIGQSILNAADGSLSEARASGLDVTPRATFSRTGYAHGCYNGFERLKGKLISALVEADKQMYSYVNFKNTLIDF